MVTVVGGASGSGKTTLAPLLRRLLPGHVVLDWDAFLDGAGRLAGVDIGTHPETWPAYAGLVRAIVDEVRPVPTVLFTVSERRWLEDWDVERWIVLDCDDVTRRARLRARGADDAAIDAAVADARAHRDPGLPTIDTTAASPDESAAQLAASCA